LQAVKREQRHHCHDQQDEREAEANLAADFQITEHENPSLGNSDSLGCAYNPAMQKNSANENSNFRRIIIVARTLVANRIEPRKNNAMLPAAIMVFVPFMVFAPFTGFCLHGPGPPYYASIGSNSMVHPMGESG
jgi:hypothetical protein